MPILAVLVMSLETITPAQVLYGGSKPKLELRNVGPGPAFNVTIDKFLSNERLLVFGQGSHMLSPEEKRALSFHLETHVERRDENNSFTSISSESSDGDPNDLYEWINKGILPDPVSITVRCRSVTSREYTSTFSFSPGDGRLKVTFEGMEPV